MAYLVGSLLTDMLCFCVCVTQWELFQLPELESYEAMLARIFMQQLERIVNRYESLRNALHREVERRSALR